MTNNLVHGVFLLRSSIIIYPCKWAMPGHILKTCGLQSLSPQNLSPKDLQKKLELVTCSRKTSKWNMGPAELVAAKSIPVLQFSGPSQNLEEYSAVSYPKVRVHCLRTHGVDDCTARARANAWYINTRNTLLVYRGTFERVTKENSSWKVGDRMG